MKKDRLLSVIVPVYNTAPYLRQCLDSILYQTYQNLEIILVADGISEDGSHEICDEYARRDERVKALHKTHGGLVNTRKAGVAAATGDYVAYVDSDDWIDLNLYESVFAAMEERSPDVLMYGYISEYKQESCVFQYGIPAGYYAGERLNTEIYSRLLKKKNSRQLEIFPCIWSKLFKREILLKSQMLVPDCVSVGEDLVCTVYTLFLAQSVMVVNIAPYHYRIRDDSMAHGGVPFERHKAMFDALYHSLLNRQMTATYLERLKQIFLDNLLLENYELFLQNDFCDVPFGNLDGRRVALYGAGKCGREIYQKTKAVFPDRIVLWVDKQYERLQKENLPVEPVTELLRREYDVIIIGLIDENICEEIKSDLINMGVAAEKIKYPSATPEALQAVNKIMQG